MTKYRVTLQRWRRTVDTTYIEVDAPNYTEAFVAASSKAIGFKPEQMISNDIVDRWEVMGVEQCPTTPSTE